VCADELTRKNTAEIVKQSLAKSEKATEGNWEEASLITDNQINSIKLLCDRLGIDANKFINSGSKKYADIVEISRQTAANMIKRLNAYQSSSNGSVEIPVDILLEK
jgi:Na+/phosphate symporter